MTMIKKNDSVKAFTAMLSKQYRYEWEIACNTNNERGKTYDQWELLKMFDREGDCWAGATKAVHKLECIVIKRHKVGGYLPEVRNAEGTGNQLIDEAEFYKKVTLLPEADLLCPVLKYFTCKSDKVSAKSETMQENVLIVAQKAVYVSDAKTCCRKAEQMNRENGYHGERTESRYAKLEKLSRERNWRDALFNGGNSGVIFDYSQNCYKAVFIDYAL